MTGSSTPMQRAVETLVDLSAMQRESIDQIGQRMDQGFAKLTEAQTQLTHTVDQLSTKIDKLTDRIDTLSQVTNAQQVIASQHAATVDNLVGLVPTLATKS